MKNLQNQKLLHRFKFWIGIIIGILFLYLAVYNLNLKDILIKIRNASLVPILVSLALRIVPLWIRGWRWQILLKPIKKTSINKLSRIVCIGEMANYLLPARLGEVIRSITVAKKENINKGTSFGIVIVDRILDLFAVLIIIFFISFVSTLPKWFNTSEHLNNYVLIAAILIILIISTILIFLLSKKYMERILNSLLFKFPNLSEKIRRTFYSFHDGLKIIGNLRKVFYGLILSLILWSIYSTAFYYIFLALEIESTWLVALAAVAITSLGTIIPSTPGYIGTTEFFIVYTLVAFSIDRTEAFACAVLSHGLQYIAIVSAGLICYLWEYPWLRKTNITKTRINFSTSKKM